ncbi:hypothetical protein Q0Z83_023590 [Actinoplanes sichuanensis]|uniref:histidine kinase n=1 Tax=Actinoplanes sichuanensis TaxID=512349 RepID=A0ABW4A0T4_9ACTN|nr:ATP-binding protein [Actinoplanes sichuanensis]BEL04168.1 hypothetical protein Q0Z83_023590 [Actinoplanes sichuanensis]
MDVARGLAADRFPPDSAEGVADASPAPGEWLDGLCRLAAHLTGAPMAALSLADAERGNLVGSHGMPTDMDRCDVVSLTESLDAYLAGRFSAATAGRRECDRASGVCDLPLRIGGAHAFLATAVGGGKGGTVAALTVFDMPSRHWSDQDGATLSEVAALLPASSWTSHRHESADPAGLLDGMPEACIAVDAAGLVRAFNRAAQRLLGFSADQVLGRPLETTLAPGYRDEPVAAALARLFAAEPVRPVRREISVRHRDGYRITTHACLAVVHGSAGPLVTVRLADRTAQDAAEEQTERQTAFLAALLNSLSVGVIACDENAHVVVVNRALRRVHHLPESASLTGRPLSAVGPTSLFNTAMQPLPWDEVPLIRALHGESLTDVEVLVQLPDQRLRGFAATARPIVGGDGRHLGAVAVAHETTTLRHTEQFRRCHHEVEKALRDTASIAEAAPAVLQAVTAALGWPCAELFLADEAGQELQAVGHHSGTGGDIDGFFDHAPIKGLGVTGRVWATGQPLWVPDISGYAEITTEYERHRAELCVRNGIRTILAVPVCDGGTLLGVLTCYAGTAEVHEDLLIVLLDGIATQIGIYIALRRAEDLARQLTRSQDDFLDLIGHEMRTPLTAITANVGLLADEADSLDEEQRHMLATVARNTSVLRRIVDALLDLSALEAGRRRLATERIDLAAVADRAILAIRLVAADRGIQVQSTVDGPVWIDGDETRLRQVLDDLLSNAVNYSPAGAEVRLDLRSHGRHTELCVTDTGIGTPEPERARVFDRFFRASNVRHHGTPGSGLGLSRARTIVRLHHGTITLEADEPTGTIVRVRLPLATKT